MEPTQAELDAKSSKWTDEILGPTQAQLDALITFCEDEECKGYGQRLVDRGYGYPVCPTTRPNWPTIPMPQPPQHPKTPPTIDDTMPKAVR